MDKDFISKSKEINKYLKILKRVADFEPKFKRKYKSEMNYAKKHNKYFKKGGDIPRYIPPHRRINKTKTYLPLQKLRQMKRKKKEHIKNVRKQSNFNLNTYTINSNSKLDEEINKYIFNSKSLKGIEYDRNEQTFVIPTTFAKFMKDEKNPIYILDEDKYYEDIFSVGREEKALVLRKRNIENELDGINLNDILNKLMTNAQFVLLFEDNDFLESISINVLENINGENAIDIYKIINSLPFINQDIEKELKKLKQFINYIYVYENNNIDNLGIVNTLYPESNFIHTRGCACNLKIPEKDFISPLFGHLNEKQLVVKTDKFNCCLKYFDVLDMYNEGIVFDKLTIIVNMEKFLKESINIFFARINEDDLYFDLVRKRLIQEYALEAPEGLREIKKVKFKLPINNKPGQYIRTYTYGTLDNNNNFTMYDKFWRKLHEGSIFTTEERYSDYSLLIKRIYNLFIYRVFLNGEKKSYFLLSKYSIKQISNYYKMIANKDIYINDEVYEILDVIGGNRNNSIETTVNYRLINSGLNFEMRILEFFNPYKEFNFKKDLPYILYSTEKSGKQKSELLEIRDKMKSIYEGQYNELMSSISNINRSPGKIIKDTGEMLEELNEILSDNTIDLLERAYTKGKTPVENSVIILRAGPVASGKTSATYPSLRMLDFNINDFVSIDIDYILENMDWFKRETRKNIDEEALSYILGNKQSLNHYLSGIYNIKNSKLSNMVNKYKSSIRNNQSYHNLQNTTMEKLVKDKLKYYWCLRTLKYSKYTLHSLMKKLIEIIIYKKYNLLMETTGAQRGIYKPLFKKLNNNQKLIIIFPFITVKDAWKRGMLRTKKQINNKKAIRPTSYKNKFISSHNKSHYYTINLLYFENEYKTILNIIDKFIVFNNTQNDMENIKKNLIKPKITIFKYPNISNLDESFKKISKKYMKKFFNLANNNLNINNGNFNLNNKRKLECIFLFIKKQYIIDQKEKYNEYLDKFLNYCGISLNKIGNKIYNEKIFNKKLIVIIFI